MMRKNGGLLIAGLVAVLVGVSLSYWGLTRNRFIVTNQSGDEIHDVIIRVGGETFEFSRLPQGGSGSDHFWIRGNEETFSVECLLATGKKVAEPTGYVVWEEDLFGVDVYITIQAEGLVESNNVSWLSP